MSAESSSSSLALVYGSEKRSALHQWHRRVQARAGHALLLWMARRWERLPESLDRRLGISIGTMARLLSPRHAHIVMLHLRLAFGNEKTDAELARLRQESYRHLGLCFAEFMRLPHMSGEEICSLVTLRGKEHIDAALGAGRGAIILTGHFGNWEITGSRITAEGYPLNVIARPQRDTEITDYLRRTREKMGMRVLHRELAVRNSLRTLQRNELLGILLDQNAGEDGIFVDFFGHLASTAPGAAAFALKTGAAVLPTFGWRQPDNTHVVEIGPAVPLIDTGDRQSDLFANTARYTKIIESQIRLHPEQWCWLHKRWKARPPDERTAICPPQRYHSQSQTCSIHRR